MSTQLLEAEVLRLRALLMQERRDVVTDLPNRRAFEAVLDAGFEGGIVIVDALNLHTANRVLGYDGGDALLRYIGRNIRRESDRVYRIGGDEFAVLCEQGVQTLIAARLMTRAGRVPLAPGVSFGLAAGTSEVYDRTPWRAAVALAHERCQQTKRRIKDRWGEMEVR